MVALPYIRLSVIAILLLAAGCERGEKALTEVREAKETRMCVAHGAMKGRTCFYSFVELIAGDVKHKNIRIRGYFARVDDQLYLFMSREAMATANFTESLRISEMPSSGFENQFDSEDRLSNEYVDAVGEFIDESYAPPRAGSRTAGTIAVKSIKYFPSVNELFEDTNN